ncbi:MAG: glycosyltransferase family 39 protein [Candidatus Binataceae bacterium]
MPVSAAPDAPAGLSRRQLLVLAAILIASAAIYFYRLGANALGASEAYSALFAAMPGAAAIVRIPLAHGNAGTVLYYLALHYFTMIFGTGEAALRGFSALLAMASVALVFVIGCCLFDAKAALAATAIWAFNPLAVVFARSGRMYSMFIAVALAQFFVLWRLRRRPSVTLAAMCGILGAAMLYTHLAGVLILAAEAVMLVRDTVRGQLNPFAWIAMALAALLFAPYAPTALALSRELVESHWLDWIGATARYSFGVKALAVAAVAAASLWLVLGSDFEPAGSGEPLRWLLAWTILPAGAMLAGSVAVRPMFNGRYVAPAAAALAILIAHVIGAYSPKIRNLAAAGFAAACLILIRFDFPPSSPWRAFAHRVAAAGTAAEPVFFESGFVFQGQTGSPNGGFPFGYYSVPFDYYFHGRNPRIAVPGYDPAAAKPIIESRVATAGGGWLISWKNAAAIRPELPDPARFKSDEILRRRDLAIYRITPIGPAARPAGTGK